VAVVDGRPGAGRRYVRNDDLVTRRVAGQTLVVPVRSSVGDLESLFTLNEVGSHLWGLLDGRRGVEELAAAVCEAFDVSEEEARADTLAFLAELEEAGLIRPCEEKGAAV
jgi:hypothetical protein